MTKKFGTSPSAAENKAKWAAISAKITEAGRPMLVSIARRLLEAVRKKKAPPSGGQLDREPGIKVFKVGVGYDFDHLEHLACWDYMVRHKIRTRFLHYWPWFADEPSENGLFAFLTRDAHFEAAAGRTRLIPRRANQKAWILNSPDYGYQVRPWVARDEFGDPPAKIATYKGSKVKVVLVFRVDPLTVDFKGKQACFKLFFGVTLKGPAVAVHGDEPGFKELVWSTAEHLVKGLATTEILGDQSGRPPSNEDLEAEELAMGLKKVGAVSPAKQKAILGKTGQAIEEATAGRPIGLDWGEVAPDSNKDISYSQATGWLTYNKKKRRLYAGQAATKALFEFLLDRRAKGLSRREAIASVEGSKAKNALTGDAAARLKDAVRQINETNRKNGIPLEVVFKDGAYRLNREVRVIRST